MVDSKVPETEIALAEKSGENMPVPAETGSLPAADAPAPTAAAPAVPAASSVPAGGVKKRAPDKKKKKRRRLIIWLCVLAVVLAGVGVGIWLLFRDTSKVTALTEVTTRGSLQTKVTGSGSTIPLKSSALKATFETTIGELFVTTGDTVNVGDPLYSVDPATLQKNLADAELELGKLKKDQHDLEKQPETLKKQIAELQKKLAGLRFKAPFAGKLLDVKVKEGDTVTEGQTLATLADDSRLRLTEYFSYAYEGQISAGMKATFSIPSAMATLSGRVESVTMVSRISPEGTRLFQVDFSVENPGTLTEGTAATAVIGEMTPYEGGTLQYNQKEELLSAAAGKVTSCSMLDYLDVASGETLLSVENTEYAGQVEDLQYQIEEAERNAAVMPEKLEKQQAIVDSIKAMAENSTVTATIAGTVTSVSVSAGDKVAADAAILTVSDASVLTIEARIDAMSVGNIKAGMPVEITQTNMDSVDTFTGTVDSVSLEGKFENNFSYFPAVIRVENPDGKLLTGNYVEYSIVAQQADDCILAPVQAIKYTDAGTVVFVQSAAKPENAVDTGESVQVPDGFWAVPVTVGISDNMYAQIVDGLDEGVTVFTQMLTDSGSSMDGGGMVVGY